jgi:hypothetical protein
VATRQRGSVPPLLRAINVSDSDGTGHVWNRRPIVEGCERRTQGTSVAGRSAPPRDIAQVSCSSNSSVSRLVRTRQHRYHSQQTRRACMTRGHAACPHARLPAAPRGRSFTLACRLERRAGLRLRTHNLRIRRVRDVIAAALSRRHQHRRRPRWPPSPAPVDSSLRHEPCHAMNALTQ